MSYVRGAAMYCQNRKFWEFLNMKTGKPVGSSEVAALVLRDLCGISSRRELAYNYEARAMYVQLVNEFNQHLRGVR